MRGVSYLSNYIIQRLMQVIDIRNLFMSMQNAKMDSS